MHHGRRLGACGMWNFLWRLGVHPQDCTVQRLPDPGGSVLWATLDAELSGEAAARLREWVRRGGYVVAAGDPRLWATVFDWNREAWGYVGAENPYAALASVLPGRAPQLLVPPGWFFGTGGRVSDARTEGFLAAVQGERQTPARATLVPLADAPALVAGAGYCYVNANPFAAFQAWLQGQEDLQPWLEWRPRLFWLDEWVSSTADMLKDVPVLPARLPRPGVRGLASTTVVIRHDVDHSRDLTYLKEEASRSVVATHAVLRDANSRFWVDTLRQHPAHESAFHYTTGTRDWFREIRARLTRRPAAGMRPSRRAVAGKGLLRQVQEARAQGIGTATLHRHLLYLVYPEWIDALHTVFENEPEVLGSSSLFRAAVLRWGTDRVDGVRGTLGQWPDAQFPSWLPFKMAHAGLDGVRLRGWESTSVMESEPELVDQLLAHRTPHLPQRVITLGYHPAHANGTTFSRDGGGVFRRVLDVLADHKVQVDTLRRVFTATDAAIAGTASA